MEFICELIAECFLYILVGIYALYTTKRDGK
jgi:hypothetical protein